MKNILRICLLTCMGLAARQSVAWPAGHPCCNIHFANVPSNIAVGCLNQIPGATPIATNDCGDYLSISLSTFNSPGCPATVTNVWTATDPNCYTTSSVSQVITVSNGVTPPSFSGIPGAESVECLSRVLDPPAVSAASGCGVSLPVGYEAQTNITSGCLATVLRTWSATDNCGLVSTAQQTVTIQPSNPPTLMGIPVSYDPVECLSQVPDWPTVTATNSCGDLLTVDTTNSATTNGCQITIVRTWLAADCSLTATVSRTIIVEPTNPPGWKSVSGDWADKTVDCPDTAPPAPVAEATNSCGDDLAVSFSAVTNGTCPTVITRTWTASDCAMNASHVQIITIQDTNPPIWNNPFNDAEVKVDKNGQGFLPDYTLNAARDTCSGVIVTRTYPTNNGPFQVGDEIPVMLKATDACGNSNNAAFHVKFVCSCSSCGSPGSGKCDDGSVDVDINLGTMTGGNSAGSLLLYAKEPSFSLGTPRALRFYPRPGGPEVIRFSSGDLRQIRSAEALADVVTLDDYSYEIRFYTDAHAGAKNSQGLYEPTGSSYVVWRIAADSNDVNRLDVSEIRGASTKEYAYVYNPLQNGWTLTSGGGLKVETRFSEWNSNLTVRTETHVIVNGSENEALRELNVFKTVSWGEAKIQVIVDPEGAALTTTRTYYEDPQQMGKYMRLASEQKPDGSMVVYDYDAEGRMTLESRNWLDSAAGTNGASVVSNGYVPVDPNDDGTVWSHRPRSVTTEAAGVVISKAYFSYTASTNGEVTEIREQCGSPAAAFGDAGNLRTITVYYPESAPLWPGQVKSIQYPDGRLDHMIYESGYYDENGGEPGDFTPGTGEDVRITTIHGTVSSPDGIADKTTREISIQNKVGRELERGTYVYRTSGDERMDWTVNKYDELGHLTASYFANGTSKFSDWGTGCCGKETDTGADGTVWVYGYDGLGRLTSRTREGMAATNSWPAQPDIVTSYGLDALGRTLLETTSADGLALVRSNQYDLAGRLSESMDSAGLETRYTYSDGGRITTVTRPGGAIEITENYLDGRVKSVTGTGVVPRFYEYGVETNGDRWTRAYTGSTNSPMWEKTTTDMLGRTVRNEKPGFGGAILTTIREYNTLGQLVAVRQLEGVPADEPVMAATLYEYDELGRVFRMALDVDADDQIDLDGPDRVNESLTHYVWTGGRWWETVVSSIYAGDGSSTSTVVNTQWSKISGSGCGCSARVGITVDAYGNPTTTTEAFDPENKMATIEQNVPYSDTDAVSVTVNGLLQSRTAPTGLTTVYSYDALGRGIGTTDPRTGTSSVHYNVAGQVDWTEDAATNRTTYAYDSVTGRRIAVTDALSNTIYTAYDLQGRVTNVWGATYPVAYEYDAYGRMAAMITWRDPNGTPDVTRWNYDEATGLLTNKVYADGTGPSCAYDAAGRLAVRTWARGVVTEYSYDDLGQLTNIDYSDSTPDVAFTYDRLGRQLTIADVLGVRTNIYDALALLEERMPDGTILARARDSLGRPSDIALDGDYGVGYGYDDFGRFASLAISNGVQFDYSYVPDSDLLAGWSVSNGAAAAYAYEPNRNLRTEVANTFDGDPISSFAYTYDAADRRTQRVDSEAVTNVFGYNLRSELVSAAMDTNLYAYAYDTIGNRQQASANEVTNVYEANELNQYTDIDEGAFMPTYDADGNMLSYGTKIYTWDAENRLVTVAPRILITGSRIYDFVYDYMGRRVKKTERRHTMLASTWVKRAFDYDGWNLIREKIETGGVISTNHYVWGLDLSGTLQGAGGVGGLLMQSHSDADSSWFSFCDANGNVTDLVDDEGTAVAHYEYDPFGNTLIKLGDNADLNPFRFSSKYWDSETGLYYYGFRYYSPIYGRWVNRDPINERGGVNTYAFTINNLINKADSHGLFTIEISQVKIGKCGEYGELATFKNRDNQIVQRVDRYNDYTIWSQCGDKCCDVLTSRKGYERTFWEFLGYQDTRNFGNRGNCSRGHASIRFETKDYINTPDNFGVQYPYDPTGAGNPSSYDKPIAWDVKPGEVRVISVSWDCTEGKFNSDTIVH